MICVMCCVCGIYMYMMYMMYVCAQNYKVADVSVNTVTWRHHKDKLIVQGVVEPHCIVIATVQVGSHVHAH